LASTALHSLTSAIPLTSNTLPSTLNTRQNSSRENTATSRSCWGDYSIDTDWYTTVPSTGVTRGIFKYHLQIHLDAITNNEQNTGSLLKIRHSLPMDIHAKRWPSTAQFLDLQSSPTGEITSSSTSPTISSITAQQSIGMGSDNLAHLNTTVCPV
jgi:hypothetical protein